MTLPKAFATYAIIAMLTFGWSANDPVEISKSTEEITIIAGLAYGAFWPFYWTYNAFEWRKGQ